MSELEQQRLKGNDDQRVTFLKGMADLQIDLTRVLVAENKNPDKLIRIDNAKEQPQLHLHGA